MPIGFNSIKNAVTAADAAPFDDFDGVMMED